MPARNFLSLAGLALGLATAGCTTAGFDTGLQTAAGYSFAAPSDLALPDTMEVTPSSFAGPSPGGAYEVAALAPAAPDPAGGAEAPEAAESLAAEARAAGTTLVAALRPDAPAGKRGRSKAPEAAMTFPPPPEEPEATRPMRDASRAEVDRLIEKYAAHYDVPVSLVRRVAKRESNFNPQAYNNGHWGLMQIKHATARGMGYDGPAKGLLDAETNLKFSVRYLRGAWLVAQGNADRADRFYQTGYYYDAKRMGLLDETGLGRDRVRKRQPGA